MKQILCFGDSNTYGYIPGTGKRYAWGERWTSILQENLRTNAPEANIKIIEEGLVGRTTVYEDATRPGLRGNALLPSVLKSHGKLDTIILMLGTNDCKSLYNASPKEIGSGIETLLKQIKAISPEAKILLISPIHLGEHVWEEGFDPDFNKHSVKVSKGLKKVYSELALKYHADFLAASDYASPSDVDQEHLTVQGHQILADAIFSKLSA